MLWEHGKARKYAAQTRVVKGGTSISTSRACERESIRRADLLLDDGGLDGVHTGAAGEFLAASTMIVRTPACAEPHACMG